MTDKIKSRLDFLLSRGYRAGREPGGADVTGLITEDSALMRAAKLSEFALDAEKPVLYGDDVFGFNRSNAALPADDVFDNSGYWDFGNVTVDYATPLACGLGGIAERVRGLYSSADAKAREFYDALLCVFDSCERLVDRYRDAARSSGCTRLYAALMRVPMLGARDYYEALVTVKFMQFALRLTRTIHVTLGRFDQYMKPYFDASVKNGATEEEIKELTELFFISLNFDTDLYTGVQQGDNGQSMVLGGCDREGRDAFNELSEICLAASEELKIIDPKINLRVCAATPLSLYERGTRLTRQGLGFPQYSNDDVVVKALTNWGYSLEDARDYTVAACWEFIVPGYGADVPNIGVMNFPLVVDRAVRKSLAASETFEDFASAVTAEIRAECDRIVLKCDKIVYAPAPFASAFILPCIESGRDVSEHGAKYNNFGIHGAGLSNAADALSAVKTLVFDKRELKPETLIAALDADFKGYEDLRRKLLDCPKMGNNDDFADNLGIFLLDAFASGLNGRPNSRGGIYRAGTGSAMEYVLSAAKVGATADGRGAGQPYASSFSPSLTARLNGPLSAVQSFTKPDLSRVCNGGPFTIEIHDAVFRNPEGEKKTAMLIKTFIDLGGHQIQINAVNRDRLLDAKKHPENYPNLIVRVWGWSGYFAELDTVYQDHIIKRAEFNFG